MQEGSPVPEGLSDLGGIRTMGAKSEPGPSRVDKHSDNDCSLQVYAPMSDSRKVQYPGQVLLTTSGSATRTPVTFTPAVAMAMAIL
jgi:hypothetical protein